MVKLEPIVEGTACRARETGSEEMISNRQASA